MLPLDLFRDVSSGTTRHDAVEGMGGQEIVFYKGLKVTGHRLAGFDRTPFLDQCLQAKASWLEEVSNSDRFIPTCLTCLCIRAKSESMGRDKI